MRITAKVDYAVRATIELGRAAPGAPVKGDHIAHEQSIPLKFLENILAELKRAGIVSSRRGAEGGYWLARPADQVHVAEIIRAVEGPLANVRGVQPQDLHYGGSAEPLQRVWVAVRASLRSVLEHVTVADLVAGTLPKEIDYLADGNDASGASVTRAPAVLLDFYGTLAASEYDGNWMSELLADHGHRLVDGADRRFASDAWDGEEHLEHSVDERTYRAWMHTRWRELLAASAVPFDDHDTLIEAIEARRASWNVVAYPEVPDVLRELRDRGHRLVVCSNWDWDLDRHLVNSGLANLFDERVSSAWVGARKPHPRIFLAAAASAGVGPEDAVMVGDNWAVDVLGALAVGMRAVHVWRHDVSPGEWLPEPPPDSDGVPRVRDLRPLPDLLDG